MEESNIILRLVDINRGAASTKIGCIKLQKDKIA